MGRNKAISLKSHNQCVNLLNPFLSRIFQFSSVFRRYFLNIEIDLESDTCLSLFWCQCLLFQCDFEFGLSYFNLSFVRLGGGEH